MNKKTYSTPSVRVVEINSNTILAGSVTGRIGDPTGAQYARGRRNSFFDDEDYEDE